MNPETVSLSLAYTWYCPECGRENIVRTSVTENDDGEEDLYPFVHEVLVVRCSYCDRWFDTDTEEWDDEDQEDTEEF